MSGLVSALIKSLDKGTFDAFVDWRDLESMADVNAKNIEPAPGYIHRVEAEEHDPRMVLEQMVREYAVQCGITNALAWQDFDRAYNLALRTNLTILRRRYCRRAGLASIGRSAYLELAGGLNDALSIAGKLLDRTLY